MDDKGLMEGRRVRGLDGVWLGRVEYSRGVEIQKWFHKRVVDQQYPSTVLFLEHPPVYTLGKRGGTGFFLKPIDELRSMGADVCQSDRGGLVTFHGPGQLVGYPILHLGTLRLSLQDYIRQLLAALVTVAGDLGVHAVVDPDRPGVYVGNSKMAAVGVRLSQQVTTHGFALNGTTDLEWFKHIVGCGIEGVGATSILEESGKCPTLAILGDKVGTVLAGSWNCRWGMRPMTSEEIQFCGTSGPLIS